MKDFRSASGTPRTLPKRYPQTERIPDGVQDFGPARVHDPGADVAAGKLIAGEEVIDIATPGFS